MIQRLFRTIERHGVWGTVKLVPRALRYALRFMNAEHRDQDRAETEFDRAHGIETAGQIPVSALDVSVAAGKSAVHYKPSVPSDVGWFLDSFEVDLSRYTFIDYGSGKGLVLLVASRHPFREIVGVEFSKQLNDVALANIASYQSAERRCASIRALHADAREFVVPKGPTIYYFYNPFKADVMENVIAQISRHNAAHLAESFILYREPAARNVIERTGHWRIVKERKGSVVYRGAASAA